MNHLDLLQVYQFDKKIRCGAKQDGGYVFAELDGAYDCYLSAGVSNEESFTRDFLAKYPLLNESNSFAFDGTIANYPYQYTTNISFIKKNIGGVNDAKHTNLWHWTTRYHDIFLKMDVEGGEYPWLQSMDEEQLSSFKQIVIEFHGITNDGWGCPYRNKVECLKKLANTHYLIHAHGNNHGPVTNKIPDVIELTYIHKKCVDTPPPRNTHSLPQKGLDFPNKSNAKDIDLNHYPFVSQT